MSDLPEVFWDALKADMMSKQLSSAENRQHFSQGIEGYQRIIKLAHLDADDNILLVGVNTCGLGLLAMDDLGHKGAFDPGEQVRHRDMSKDELNDTSGTWAREVSASGRYDVVIYVNQQPLYPDTKDDLIRHHLLGVIRPGGKIIMDAILRNPCGLTTPCQYVRGCVRTVSANIIPMKDCNMAYTSVDSKQVNLVGEDEILALDKQIDAMIDRHPVTEVGRCEMFPRDLPGATSIYAQLVKEGENIRQKDSPSKRSNTTKMAYTDLARIKYMRQVMPAMEENTALVGETLELMRKIVVITKN